MKKTGLADSPLFSPPSQKVERIRERPVKLAVAKEKADRGTRERGTAKFKTSPPHRHRGGMQPRNHATTVSRYHDTIIEQVRKAVKELGKEAATHRFTQAEKQAIAEVLYVYKNQGTRSSENEITRIAVNFIIKDYQENGESSVLHRVLQALNG